jgi:hypothetical protein
MEHCEYLRRSQRHLLAIASAHEFIDLVSVRPGAVHYNDDFIV